MRPWGWGEQGLPCTALTRMPAWERVCPVQSWQQGKGALLSETSRCRLCSTAGLCKHRGVSLSAFPASCGNHLCAWVMQRKRKHLSKVSGCVSLSSICRHCLLRFCICLQMARARFSAVAINGRNAMARPCRHWAGMLCRVGTELPCAGNASPACWGVLPNAQGEGDPPHCQSLPAPGGVAVVPGVSCFSHSVGPSVVSLLMGNSAE